MSRTTISKFFFLIVDFLNLDVMITFLFFYLIDFFKVIPNWPAPPIIKE